MSENDITSKPNPVWRDVEERECVGGGFLVDDSGKLVQFRPVVRGGKVVEESYD